MSTETDRKPPRRVLRWGTLVPLALTAVACILFFVQPLMPRTAFAAASGALLLVSGLVCAAAFFFGQPMHAARMLAGVVQVSVGLWALISCTNFTRSVLALGLGVFLLLAAAAEIFAALAARGHILICVLRFVLAAGYAVTGLLLILHNFVLIFPSVDAALMTAGAFMLLFCAEELLRLLREGAYFEKP